MIKIAAPPAILQSMVNDYPDYTEVEDLRIFVGTWNVNGGKHFRSIAHKHESVSDWLLDAASITKEKNPGLSTKKSYFGSTCIRYIAFILSSSDLTLLLNQKIAGFYAKKNTCSNPSRDIINYIKMGFKTMM